jgi:hypothetical protein
LATKIKIILQPEQFSTFTSWYLQSLWQDYFDIEIYDEKNSYCHCDLFVFWIANAKNKIIDRLYNLGHKIVIDNLWEVYNNELAHFYQLCNPNNWWWWNESLWWRARGYNQYIPKKTYNKIALMPIRRVNKVRNLIVEKIQPWADQMIWSYKDRYLPGDKFLDSANEIDQRFMNPIWYDQTCINLVIESTQESPGLIVSEKTYKPIAFYHPMLIVGQSGVLQIIKNQGFETFDNIFDESYDQEKNFGKRLEIILSNLNRVRKEPYCDLTWKKLEHNQNHFFNEKLVKKFIVKEIIEPLIEYAET